MTRHNGGPRRSRTAVIPAAPPLDRNWLAALVQGGASQLRIEGNSPFGPGERFTLRQEARGLPQLFSVLGGAAVLSRARFAGLASDALVERNLIPSHPQLIGKDRQQRQPIDRHKDRQAFAPDFDLVNPSGQ